MIDEPISRRRFLNILTGGAATAALMGCGAEATPTATPQRTYGVAPTPLPYQPLDPPHDFNWCFEGMRLVVNEKQGKKDVRHEIDMDLEGKFDISGIDPQQVTNIVGFVNLKGRVQHISDSELNGMMQQIGGVLAKHDIAVVDRDLPVSVSPNRVFAVVTVLPESNRLTEVVEALQDLASTTDKVTVGQPRKIEATPMQNRLASRGQPGQTEQGM